MQRQQKVIKSFTQSPLNYTNHYIPHELYRKPTSPAQTMYCVFVRACVSAKSPEDKVHRGYGNLPVLNPERLKEAKAHAEKAVKVGESCWLEAKFVCQK